MYTVIFMKFVVTQIQRNFHSKRHTNIFQQTCEGTIWCSWILLWFVTEIFYPLRTRKSLHRNFCAEILLYTLIFRNFVAICSDFLYSFLVIFNSTRRTVCNLCIINYQTTDTYYKSFLTKFVSESYTTILMYFTVFCYTIFITF